MLAHQINFDQYLNNTIDKEGNTERQSLQAIIENEEEIALQDTYNEEYGSYYKETIWIASSLII